MLDGSTMKISGKYVNNWFIFVYNLNLFIALKKIVNDYTFY